MGKMRQLPMAFIPMLNIWREEDSKRLALSSGRDKQVKANDVNRNKDKLKMQQALAYCINKFYSALQSLQSQVI